jgi:hypothetical protein
VSVYQINKFLYRLENDPAFLDRARTDLAATLREFRLTPAELAALQSGDVATLYRQGVHPFLLMRLAGYNLTLSRDDYAARIRGAG